jgi:hypothetical protein
MNNGIFSSKLKKNRQTDRHSKEEKSGLLAWSWYEAIAFTFINSHLIQHNCSSQQCHSFLAKLLNLIHIFCIQLVDFLA